MADGDPPDEFRERLERNMREQEDVLAKLAETDGPDQEPRTVANMPCPLPPEGWYCTRPAGHDGPCAAIEYTQEPRTGGVAVHRSRDGHLGDWDYWAHDGYEYPNTVSEPGTWLPLAEAEALEAVVDAAMGVNASDAVWVREALTKALVDLAVLRSKP